MLRRFFWTSATLALLVLSWAWKSNLTRFLERSLPRQLLMLSTVVAFVGVVLLIPLALWWNRGASLRIRRLRAAASLLAWGAIGLSILSLLIHPSIDHGATGKYPGWDWSLGLAYFGWEHHYFLHGTIVGLFAGSLLAKHKDWTAPIELGTEPELQQMSARFERLVRAGQLTVAVALLVFDLVGGLRVVP